MFCMVMPVAPWPARKIIMTGEICRFAALACNPSIPISTRTPSFIQHRRRADKIIVQKYTVAVMVDL